MHHHTNTHEKEEEKREEEEVRTRPIISQFWEPQNPSIEDFLQSRNFDGRNLWYFWWGRSISSDCLEFLTAIQIDVVILFQLKPLWQTHTQKWDWVRQELKKNYLVGWKNVLHYSWKYSLWMMQRSPNCKSTNASSRGWQKYLLNDWYNRGHFSHCHALNLFPRQERYERWLNRFWRFTIANF